MTQLFIEAKRTNRKNKPIDVNISCVGGGCSLDDVEETLIYAFLVFLDEKKSATKKAQSAN